MQCARSPTSPQLQGFAHAERARLQACPRRSARPDRRPVHCASVTPEREPEGAACEASHSSTERLQQYSSPQPVSRRSLSAQPQSLVQNLVPLSTGALLAVAAASAAAFCPEPALAWQLRQEPSNALSLPTWAIHVSSVYEWGLAMALMWKYADVTGNPRWKGMTWGMVPLLGGAFAACTFHFFYNSPDVEFLVPLQAFLTFAGNTTLAIAAYRIYAAAEKPAEP